MPGRGGNQADIHLVIPVRPGVAVLDEDLLALKIGQQPVMDEIEFFRRKGLVLLPPMNLGGAGGLFDNEFILGRAAGIGAGAHHHRPQVGDESFLWETIFSYRAEVGKFQWTAVDVSDAVMLLSLSSMCYPLVVLLRQARLSDHGVMAELLFIRFRFWCFIALGSSLL